MRKVLVTETAVVMVAAAVVAIGSVAEALEVLVTPAVAAAAEAVVVAVQKTVVDQLRLAKYRLNAYRGLVSEAYISLSSKDPILSAFELGAELKRLSRVEEHFKVSLDY